MVRRKHRLKARHGHEVLVGLERDVERHLRQAEAHPIEVPRLADEQHKLGREVDLYGPIYLWFYIFMACIVMAYIFMVLYSYGLYSYGLYIYGSI